TPPVHVARLQVVCPWEEKGRVMRMLAQDPKTERTRQIDGVSTRPKANPASGSWCCLTPTGLCSTYTLRRRTTIAHGCSATSKPTSSSGCALLEHPHRHRSVRAGSRRSETERGHAHELDRPRESGRRASGDLSGAVADRVLPQRPRCRCGLRRRRPAARPDCQGVG